MALKVSSTPPEVNINMPNILKIEKLLSDSAYSELIEFSANFNTRLCVERKLRMPFLDPQTGVAQKHSNLYMKRTQRMPGLREGQIYSYPSIRWRNKTNSIKLSSRPFFRFRVNDNCSTTTMASTINHTISQINSNSNATTTNNNGSSSTASTSNGLDGEASDFQTLIDQESNSMTGGGDTDSKDSQEVPKDWYYDDMDVNDAVSEEQADSDFDYNINGYKRKKKGPVRKTSRKPKDSFEESNSTSTRKRSSGAGGRSAAGSSSSSTNSRSRNKKGSRSATKGSSSSSAKDGNRETTTTSSFFDIEPPSFAKVQDDLKLTDNSADSFAYRKY